MLALAERIGSRDQAYAVVQKLAQAESDARPFQERAKAHPLVRSHLNDDELAEIFDWSHYLRHAQAIMRRALAHK